MPKKTTVKKITKNKTRRNISFTRLIFIILAIIVALAFLFFSIFLPGRKNSKPEPATPVSKSSPSFRKDGSLEIIRAQNTSAIYLDIEIADDEGERIKGLMDRYNLPENAGMLFIFSNEEPRSFWMKNTYISLDIIYINENKQIVSIQKYTQPRTTYSIPSEKPARYVLETNAGYADKYNINPGDQIKFSY